VNTEGNNTKHKRREVTQNEYFKCEAIGSGEDLMILHDIICKVTQFSTADSDLIT
jgi:hypothetical protein